MPFKNDLILRAARGEQVERTPVWLMRQAGRVLPEYRAVRSKMGGFKELVETPEFACEVTIQPVDILNVDAAIIFSDILFILQFFIKTFWQEVVIYVLPNYQECIKFCHCELFYKRTSRS